MLRVIGVGLATLGLMLGSTGVAQGDDQAFLEQIPPRNYLTMWVSDQQRLAMGYGICGQIRNGMSPNVIADGMPANGGWGFVGPAQHELCPDTL